MIHETIILKYEFVFCCIFLNILDIQMSTSAYDWLFIITYFFYSYNYMRFSIYSTQTCV